MSWLPLFHLQHVSDGDLGVLQVEKGRKGPDASGSVVTESSRLKEKGNPPLFFFKSQEVVGGGNGAVISVLSL